MIYFLLFVLLPFWIIFGVCLMVMAGLTWHFAERHFNPLWMVLLGPLGIVAWRLAEKREVKKCSEKSVDG